MFITIPINSIAIKRHLNKTMFALILLVFLTSCFQSKSDIDPPININSTIVDTSFGENGLSIINPTPGNDFVTDILVDNSNQTIVSGRTDYYEDKNNNSDFLLVRYLENGQLDKRFGENGLVKTDFHNHEDILNTITVDKENRILAAGSSKKISEPNQEHLIIARYLNDGSLDISFGSQGLTLVDFQDTLNTQKTNHAIDIQVTEDEKILVLGIADRGNHIYGSTISLIRLESNGKLDNTFGNNGKLFLEFPMEVLFPDDFSMISGGYLTGLSILNTNNKILISGSLRRNATLGTHFVFIELDSNGLLTQTFGQNGIYIHQTELYTGGISSFIKTSNNKLLSIYDYAELDEYVLPEFNCAIKLFNLDGTIDKTFGNEGEVSANTTTGDFSQLPTCPRAIVSAKNNTSSYILDSGFGFYEMNENGIINIANEDKNINDIGKRIAEKFDWAYESKMITVNNQDDVLVVGEAYFSKDSGDSAFVLVKYK